MRERLALHKEIMFPTGSKYVSCFHSTAAAAVQYKYDNYSGAPVEEYNCTVSHASYSLSHGININLLVAVFKKIYPH